MVKSKSQTRRSSLKRALMTFSICHLASALKLDLQSRVADCDCHVFLLRLLCSGSLADVCNEPPSSEIKSSA